MSEKKKEDKVKGDIMRIIFEECFLKKKEDISIDEIIEKLEERGYEIIDDDNGATKG